MEWMKSFRSTKYRKEVKKQFVKWRQNSHGMLNIDSKLVSNPEDILKMDRIKECMRALKKSAPNKQKEMKR